MSVVSLKCDKKMVEDLVKSQNSYSMAFSTQWGTFDKSTCGSKHADFCSHSPVGCPAPDQCCGEYPEKMPFWSNHGEKQCCGLTPYSTTTAKCCYNGYRIVEEDADCSNHVL